MWNHKKLLASVFHFLIRHLHLFVSQHLDILSKQSIQALLCQLPGVQAASIKSC